MARAARHFRRGATFLVVFLAVGTALDLVLGRPIHWLESLLSAVIATVIFSGIMAFLDRRKQAEEQSGEQG